MLSSLYKKHTILALASQSSGVAADFTPIALVGWNISSSERGSQTLISPERYPTAQEAIAVAFQKAKDWIDQHVRDDIELH